MLQRIRNHIRALAGIHLALFALAWLSVVAAPCAAAMQSAAMAETAHECPHCPPRPCHEVQPDDCAEPDSLDAPRAAEPSGQWLLPPVAMAWPVAELRGASHEHFDHRSPPARAGPRAHLFNAQFNE